MRGFLIHGLLAAACVAGLGGCSDDGEDDGEEVSVGAGKGGTGGTGGDGESGTGGDGESGTGGGSIACTEDATECPAATVQTDGVPCCTVEVDVEPYYGSRTVGVCGLFFTGRLPCFELAAPGEVDEDECPQGLDQGWGSHPGCCHPYGVCGILNGDTGCTLYRPTALTPDGEMIGGMGSGSFECEPGPGIREES
jgi:hypothetical protein